MHHSDEVTSCFLWLLLPLLRRVKISADEIPEAILLFYMIGELGHFSFVRAYQGRALERTHSVVLIQIIDNRAKAFTDFRAIQRRWPAMDIIVVGAGIIGMFASYYLLQNGFSVTIVDMDPMGGRTSVCNAGLIVPSFATTPPMGLRKVLLAYIGRQGPIYVSPREILKNASWLRALRAARDPRNLLLNLGR